jgi:hypothetical protein
LTSTASATQAATATPTATPSSGDFPLTAILDSFNRANGAVGGSWSGNTGNYAVYGEQLDVVGNGSLLWNASSFGPAQEVFVTLAAADPAAGSVSLLLKSQSNTSPNSGVIRVLYSLAGQFVQVTTYASGQGWVQRGTNLSASFASGDQFGARALATGVVEVYRNGALIGVRDASGWTHTASGGFAGLWMAGATNVMLDDFGAGTVGGGPMSIPEVTVTPTTATPSQTPAPPPTDAGQTATPTPTSTPPAAGTAEASSSDTPTPTSTITEEASSPIVSRRPIRARQVV